MPTDTAKLLFTFFMSPWLAIIAVATRPLIGHPIPYLVVSYLIFAFVAIRIWQPSIYSSAKTLLATLLLRWLTPIILLIATHYFIIPMSPLSLGILSGGLFVRGALLVTKKISQEQYQYMLDNNIDFEPQKNLFHCPDCQMDLTASDTLHCPGCSRSYTVEEFLNLHNSLNGHSHMKI